MARAKLGPVKIRHTLLGAEGLSSRVTVNKESIQYIHDKSKIINESGS